MNIDQIQVQIKEEILKALNKIGFKDAGFEVTLDRPKDRTFGDFTTNTAMRVSKVLGKSPQIISKELVDLIGNGLDVIEKIEVAGPGFINIYLKQDSLSSIINVINKLGQNYGNSVVGANQSILLEYVSANPTGFLHIGHARGGAYGDSLARILDKAGYNVYKEFYINDAGNQINNLAISILARYMQELGKDYEMPENAYFGPEIIQIAKDLIQEKGNGLTENDLDFFKSHGLEYLKTQLKSHLNNYRVTFDNWFSEQSLYDSNKVQAVFDELVDRGFTYTQDGAVYAKTSDFGDEKDRVLLTSDGRFTYLVPDIAYHKEKYDRGYNQLVNVLGADHHGYLDRLRATMSMLGYDSSKIKFEILQMVKVYQNGEEVKMSKRSGKAIGLEDLIDEVGVDPIRYFFAARNLSSPMELDLDLALRSSNENPVFYAQYAHARICSVLRTAKEQNIEFLNDNDLSHLNEKHSELLSILSEYEEVISNSAQKRLPHIVANYIQKLSSAFHSLYNSDKFLTENVEETIDKLKLVNSIKIVLSNSLELIGVSAPEKM